MLAPLVIAFTLLILKPFINEFLKFGLKVGLQERTRIHLGQKRLLLRAGALNEWSSSKKIVPKKVVRAQLMGASKNLAKKVDSGDSKNVDDERKEKWWDLIRVGKGNHRG